MTKKYEDDTGEGGWVSAEESAEERKLREERGEPKAAALPITAAEKARKGALAAEEKEAKELEEIRGKERVRDKLARLVGQLKSGTLFGVDRKRAWEAVEELVGWLKGDETVGEKEAERAKEEEKRAKKVA